MPFKVLIAAVCATGLYTVSALAEPSASPGKADKLAAPPTLEPVEDYPVATTGKEDRQPVPAETTKRKSQTAASTADRLVPDPPNPDRLRPE